MPGLDRRAEQPRALERRLGRRQLRQRRLAELGRTARALRRAAARASMRPWPRCCHSAKNRSHNSCRKRPRSSGVRVSSSSGCSSSRSTSDAKNWKGQSRYRSSRLTDTRGRRQGPASPGSVSPRRLVDRDAPRPSGRRPRRSTCGDARLERQRLGRTTRESCGSSARLAARQAERATSSSRIDGSTTASFSSAKVDSRTRARGEPQQVPERRARAVERVALAAAGIGDGGQRLEQREERRRIEHVAPDALRPLAVDQARRSARRRSRRSGRPARRRSAGPARRCAPQTSGCRASGESRRSERDVGRRVRIVCAVRAASDDQRAEHRGAHAQPPRSRGVGLGGEADRSDRARRAASRSDRRDRPLAGQRRQRRAAAVSDRSGRRRCRLRATLVARARASIAPSAATAPRVDRGRRDSGPRRARNRARATTRGARPRRPARSEMRRSQQRQERRAREIRRDGVEREIERGGIRLGRQRQRVERFERDAGVGKHVAREIEIRQRAADDERCAMKRRRPMATFASSAGAPRRELFLAIAIAEHGVRIPWRGVTRTGSDRRREHRRAPP